MNSTVRFTFGKHPGALVEDGDSSYLRWVMGTDIPVKHPELGEAITAVLNSGIVSTVSRGPKKQGQLWEECRCGNEPVNMPLHLCDSCWPSA